MIRSIVIDDEQHRIDSIGCRPAKNCGNGSSRKMRFRQRRDPAIKKYKPRLIFLLTWKCPDEWL